MMYRVYADDQLIYHSNLEGMRLLNPSLELEMNKTGSFTFTMHPDHPRYSMIQKLKSIMMVYQDDYLLFRGRVLEEEVGWHNQKAIVCEGQLAFLLDSVLRPFAYTGTPAEFLAYVLALHNAQVDAEKQFQLGNVTVEGYVAHDTKEYATTKATLDKVLLDVLGGYFIPRYENGVAYLDYLADITLLAPQSIEFGKNLMDMKIMRKGADIATVVIPLGAKLKDEEGKDTEERLTIASVNDGADFLQNDDAVSRYGVIVKAVIFDDITEPETLKIQGRGQLALSVKMPDSIELTAADMAATGQDITSFHIGTQVRVYSKPHGISQLFVVSKLSLNLLEPGANKMTLGATLIGLAGSMAGVVNTQGQILQEAQKTAQRAAETVYNVEQNLLASIQVEAENIKSVVAETYSLKDDTEALISAVSTEVEQTKNSVEIQFTQFSQDVEAVAAGVDAEFEALHSYIRFEDGNIIQGGRDSPFQKVQSATKESYYDSGAEVAYFSNKKLYVTDGEYTHSLRVGKLLVTPRENGNTSINIV